MIDTCLRGGRAEEEGWKQDENTKNKQKNNFRVIPVTSRRSAALSSGFTAERDTRVGDASRAGQG